jgi:hypothetical protein
MTVRCSPLCRLRYAGWAGLWGFAIYSGRGNRYENSVLPSGDPIAEAHEAFDCACGLHLGDPSAWSPTTAGDP